MWAPSFFAPIKFPNSGRQGEGSHAMEVLTQGVTHVLRSDISELLVGFAVLVTLLVLAGLIFQIERFP
jgi:hypothetical protein